MKKTHFAYLATTLLCTATTACGSLADSPGDADVLAKMNGTLSVAAGTTAPSAVRVALVWRNDGREKSGAARFNVAEDLEVSPQFPARFSLTLRNPPPASALSVPEKSFDMPIAIGSVVAYEDKNQNAKLDLVPAKATSFVDAIVGATDELLVVWLSREPTGASARELRDPQGKLPRAGYNLYLRRDSTCPTSSGEERPSSSPGSGSPATASPCTERSDRRWLPIDAAFDLPIVSDPKFSKLMCQSEDSGVAPDGPPEAKPSPAPDPAPNPNPGSPFPPVPTGPFPTPGTRGLTCAPNGRSFVFEDCKEPGLCEADFSCAGRAEFLPAGAAAPPGWPCTVR